MADAEDRDPADEINAELLDASRVVLAQLDYLQSLWGKEAITDRLAERLRAAVAKSEKGA